MDLRVFTSAGDPLKGLWRWRWATRGLSLEAQLFPGPAEGFADAAS